MTDDDRSEDTTRPLPYDEHIEAAILGASILSTKARGVLVAELRAEDFYVHDHQRVATVLIEAFEAGHEVDAMTLAYAMNEKGWLTDTFTAGSILAIQAACPSTSSAPRYAAIVHENATLRRLIEASSRISAIGYEGGNAHEAVVAAQALLGHVAGQNGSRSYSSIEVADTAALIAGDLEAPDADFLSRTDGLNLLYAGKMHVFQAEPSTGKTWLALLAALEILAVGGSVLYLDYEDSSRGILGRLLALGADPTAVIERFQYAQPTGAFTTSEKIVLDSILDRLNPDLVVIDGVAEALARDGLSEDKAADVVQWVERLPRPIARTGAAVLMLDHVVKDREQQGRWARGSSAKLGAVDGAAYSLKTATGFSRKKSGGMRVVIAKDRPGGVGSIGDTAAMVSIEPHADGTRVMMKVEPDTAAKHVADAFRPTGLMAKVSREIETSTVALTARALRALIHSDKPKYVSEAIARLVAEGYLRESRQGTATFLIHVKPYTGDGTATSSEPAPEDNPELPLGPTLPEAPDDVVVDLDAWKKDNF